MMYKHAAILLCGILIGSFATYLFSASDIDARFAEPPERDIDPEKIVELTTSEASKQRKDRYESIKTIADTLALPTDFAETEALYVLAGRSSSEELQDLIHQAIRIKDKMDSNAALDILFLRLVEVDPLSAVAIARSPAFQGDRIHESNVWKKWGRLDLDAALVAARQGTTAQRNLAAQGLYISLRGTGDDKVQRIEAELGIAPDTNAKGQRLYALAAESPALAIEYIESLKSPIEQQERYGWLAYYLHRTGRAMGEDYSHRIQSATNRRVFKESVERYRAQSDPEAALKEALAGNSGMASQQKALLALQQLAQIEPEKALKYLDQIPNINSQRTVKMTAAAAMARSDPGAALEWVRNNDDSLDQSLLIGVLTQIAQQDMHLAIAEAQNITNLQMRDQVYAGIMTQAAMSNPEEASRMIELIDDPQARRRGLRQLTGLWVTSDVDAAFDWAMSLGEDEQREALLGMGQSLVHNDVDAAIRILQRMPAEDAVNLQTQITQSLAQQRSIEDAQAFVDQFEGTEGHAIMQAVVVNNLAASNPGLAMQMAGTISDEATRDQTVASIVGQQAGADPRQALHWLNSISDPSARSGAMIQIAYGWHQRDPVAAMTWVDNLPAGRERDRVLATTVSMRSGSSAEILGVIDSITDDEMRHEATRSYIVQLAYTNKSDAKRLLQEMDLTDLERESLERRIDDRHTIYD